MLKATGLLLNLRRGLLDVSRECWEISLLRACADQRPHQLGDADSGNDPGTGQGGRNITREEEFPSSQSRRGAFLLAVEFTLVLGRSA